MAEDKKNRIDTDAYRNYIAGNMTPAERHAFEKTMLDDPFAHDALEGMESMDPAHIAEDLKALKTQLAQRTKKKEQPLFWRIAAALLLLGIFSFVIYYFIDTRAHIELAQEKTLSPEKSDTLALQQKSTADSVRSSEPDRIIAYQQEIIDESAPSPANKRVSEESPTQNPAVDQSEKEEVIREDQDFDTADQLEEIAITAEKPEVETRSLSAAVSEVDASEAEQKKEATSGAKRQKARVSEQPGSIDGAALVVQERKIKGKVTTVEDDSPAPGVNVLIKGASVGTITDIDGNYEITIPAAEEATLVFSYIGFTTEEVSLKKDETAVDVALSSDMTALSEIVVIGYGSSATNDPAPYSYSPPKPVGRQAKFKDYIDKNLQYPASMLASGVMGTVRIQFTITTAGTMTNIQVIRSLGEDFDKEALRLITDGPRWEPAEENGSRVARDVKVTIRFKPPE
ncbi:MAG: TonB family protein [Cyclobacteriaceae bacterium]|nr:TonB family protein [Cyclobacteriaceae bacterium]